MTQAQSHNLRRNASKAASPGDIDKKVVYTVLKADGTEESVLAFREREGVDPVTGAVKTRTEVFSLVDGAGQQIKVKQVEGYCKVCGRAMARSSWHRCCECGQGVGTCHARQGSDDEFYCPRCFSRFRVRSFLLWAGKVLLFFFIDWEADDER